MKQKHFIDSHKGVTFVAILLMMAWFDQWSNPTAWIYLALHGTYGILWMLKSRIFPDAQWQQETSLWYGLVIWGSLTLYWIPAYLLTSRGIQAPPWVLGLAVSINILGVFLHFTTDMQKFIQLKLQPGKLISDGMMARVRNGNYFGELLIYGAFALLAMTWLAFIPLALFVAAYWTPNMIRKEKMLAALPGFEEYKRKSKIFIPFLF
ncbi:MAG: steroid 5-alpha reductase [Chloroflexi bacterium]|nr:MAG: steroid 5-alpha reductase [Chloroflexota bacterium]